MDHPTPPTPEELAVEAIIRQSQQHPSSGTGKPLSVGPSPPSAVDTGLLQIEVRVTPPHVVLFFGHVPVTWVGFTPRQAIDLANTLVNAATLLGPLPPSPTEGDPS